jgi:hypothetical protein
MLVFDLRLAPLLQLCQRFSRFSVWLVLAGTHKAPSHQGKGPERQRQLCGSGGALVDSVAARMTSLISTPFPARALALTHLHGMPNAPQSCGAFHLAIAVVCCAVGHTWSWWLLPATCVSMITPRNATPPPTSCSSRSASPHLHSEQSQLERTRAPRWLCVQCGRCGAPHADKSAVSPTSPCAHHAAYTRAMMQPGRAPTPEEAAQMEAEEAAQRDAEMQFALVVFGGYVSLCGIFHVAVRLHCSMLCAATHLAPPQRHTSFV